MSSERKQGHGVAARRGEHRPLAAWPEHLDRLFDRWFQEFDEPPWRALWRWPAIWRTQGWVPEIDVFEEDGKLVVRADLPGMNREDIDIEVDGDRLVVRGRREEEKEVKEENYYRCERARGGFTRVVSLPEGVKPDAIEAKYQDGVLEIKAPLSSNSAAKKVKVPLG